MALKHTAIDAASFTAIRLAAGAIVLALLTLVPRAGSGADNKAGASAGHGNWLSALALFAYAAAFSYAYLTLSAATGALLLFGAVQATMIGAGIANGERLRGMALAGFVLAIGGLAWLLAPGVAAPPMAGSALMIVAGIAWGIYSLRGRRGGAPLFVTAGNFMRAAPIALVLCLAMVDSLTLDWGGAVFAIASGALTSGVGYAIWYTALPSLKATHAATLQLSVPVITAIGGIVFLGEMLTLRLVVSSVAVLGGIGMVVGKK
ncbi:MAG: DMT family transporter [Betaproteobacteria bacterium]|nr:DMT family transporter [Betaproteobacteria bacterium]